MDTYRTYPAVPGSSATLCFARLAIAIATIAFSERTCVAVTIAENGSSDWRVSSPSTKSAPLHMQWPSYGHTSRGSAAPSCRFRRVSRGPQDCRRPAKRMSAEDQAGLPPKRDAGRILDRHCRFARAIIIAGDNPRGTVRRLRSAGTASAAVGSIRSRTQGHRSRPEVTKVELPAGKVGRGVADRLARLQRRRLVFQDRSRGRNSKSIGR